MPQVVGSEVKEKQRNTMTSKESMALSLLIIWWLKADLKINNHQNKMFTQTSAKRHCIKTRNRSASVTLLLWCNVLSRGSSLSTQISQILHIFLILQNYICWRLAMYRIITVWDSPPPQNLEGQEKQIRNRKRGGIQMKFIKSEFKNYVIWITLCWSASHPVTTGIRWRLPVTPHWIRVYISSSGIYM